MSDLKKGARLEQTAAAKTAIQMTKDEKVKPGKELERAHGVSYALRAQLWQESAQHDSWLQMLDELEQARPWMYLPEDAPAGEFWAWMAATYELPGGIKVTKDRLHAILTSFANAELEARAIEFYKTIEDPLYKGTRTGRPPKSRNPGNDISDTIASAKRGNTKAYLLDRIMREHPEVAEQIGPKPKPYASVQAAAIALGLIKPRQRYEVNPDVNVSNAAKRIFELLGPDKTAALITQLTTLCTK